MSIGSLFTYIYAKCGHVPRPTATGENTETNVDQLSDQSLLGPSQRVSDLGRNKGAEPVYVLMPLFSGRLGV